MSEQRAQTGPAVRFPPPLIFLATILAAVAVHMWVVPSPELLPWRSGLLVGGAVFVVGVILMVIPHRLFDATGQDPKPWKPVPSLVTSGPFRFTRNPMYLAVVIMQTGVGLALGNAWVLVATPVAMVAITRLVIRHEEAYLAREFGDQYREYKDRVRRWI